MESVQSLNRDNPTVADYVPCYQSHESETGVYTANSATQVGAREVSGDDLKQHRFLLTSYLQTLGRYKRQTAKTR